jgi:hypothetical protein
LLQSAQPIVQGCMVRKRTQKSKSRNWNSTTILLRWHKKNECSHKLMTVSQIPCFQSTMKRCIYRCQDWTFASAWRRECVTYLFGPEIHGSTESRSSSRYDVYMFSFWGWKYTLMNKHQSLPLLFWLSLL